MLTVHWDGDRLAGDIPLDQVRREAGLSLSDQLWVVVCTTGSEGGDRIEAGGDLDNTGCGEQNEVEDGRQVHGWTMAEDTTAEEKTRTVLLAFYTKAEDKWGLHCDK